MEDTFKLTRFLYAQNQVYLKALGEIQQGQKQYVKIKRDRLNAMASTIQNFKLVRFYLEIFKSIDIFLSSTIS